MQKSLNILKRPRASVILVLGIAVLFSAVLVFADTTSTTVTVGNAAPTIDLVELDRTTVTLSENAFTFSSTTITITDTNGCSDITSVTAKLYRDATNSGGTNCTANDNNCYTPTVASDCVATTTGNQCTGGSDTQVEYDCGFKLWYLADPTNAGGFASDIWVVSATTTDGTDTVSATNTAQTVEVNQLFAINLDSGTIAFGTVAAGANTGAINQALTHTNTGNTSLDNQISGDVMCTDYNACDGDSFHENQQKFDTSDVTYASLTNTLAATASPAT